MTADEKAQKEQPVGYYYFWNNAKKITEIKKKKVILQRSCSLSELRRHQETDSFSTATLSHVFCKALWIT